MLSPHLNWKAWKPFSQNLRLSGSNVSSVIYTQAVIEKAIVTINLTAESFLGNSLHWNFLSQFESETLIFDRFILGFNLTPYWKRLSYDLSSRSMANSDSSSHLYALQSVSKCSQSNSSLGEVTRYMSYTLCQVTEY